ncbi:peptidoglycan DD-metalloendopeptidase family protein [Brumicola pallidula]|jgi:murein DD-endopeptidase MepM/ murein hydrolase activator NlpD|uniref:M23/M37 peptidase domain protein n=1 Tax=Brumicola pallidula DSM 14239 = ACAM 615 TaxID=1121922 RepID=K6YDR9_9ALTE|nr:M23 family metallopeptidase [Glaciecola pallidula]GAC30879.1 M23/M37 peptidase domain protein [Glaciecola pallidula DSM 14239 = ACAM 615]
MSFTILYKGKNRRFVKRISARKLLSVSVIASIVFLISSRSTESVYENHVRVNVVKTGLEQQAKLVDQLKTNTLEQVGGIVNQVAIMQNRINKMELLTATMAENAGLNKEDFTLSEEMQTLDASESSLTNQINKMAETLDFKIQQLTALESLMMGLNIERESELAGRPLGKGWLSSYYGVRKDPFTGRPAMHKGIDFAGKEGEDVIATGAGVVTWSGSRYGYGNLVEIDHGNGLRTRYGHNAKLTVVVGDVVTKGQGIALVGNTGRSTGAHVHYEVLKNGQQVDPLPFIYR